MSENFRSILIFAPIVLGWIVGLYFSIRAYKHLHLAKPGRRLWALLFGEFGVALYSPEGHWDRLYAFLSFIVGAAITITLDITLGH